MARILVIDDDLSLATAIEMVLQNYGFEVVVANSGRSALDLVEAADVDVIILDMVMPGMNGLETIQAFRQRVPAVPIIATSGFGESRRSSPDVLATATQCGAAFSLRKPFGISDLISAIRACGAFSIGDPGLASPA
jgi:CheY-like chemotaxis protein